MTVYPVWRESYPDPEQKIETKRKTIISSSGKKNKESDKLFYDKNGKIPFPKKMEFNYSSLNTFNNLDELLNKLSKTLKDYQSSNLNNFTVVNPNLFQKDPKSYYIIGSPINSDLQIYKSLIVDGKVENPVFEALAYADEQLEEVINKQHHVAISYTTLTSNITSIIENIPSNKIFSKDEAFSAFGLSKEQYIDIEYIEIEVGQETSSIIIQKTTPF